MILIEPCEENNLGIWILRNYFSMKSLKAIIASQKDIIVFHCIKKFIVKSVIETLNTVYISCFS